MSDDADELRLKANTALRELIEEQATAAMRERLEIAEARLYLVSDALARLLSFVDRIGGYTEPDDQAAIRLARSALAEALR